jgi:uncharacterized membrane protein YqiK
MICLHITENMVGVVTTLDGLPIEEGNIAGKPTKGHNNFQDCDAFLANGGNKGLQPEIILAGSYYLNPWFIQVEQIKMTEIPLVMLVLLFRMLDKMVKI